MVLLSAGASSELPVRAAASTSTTGGKCHCDAPRGGRYKDAAGNQSETLTPRTSSSIAVHGWPSISALLSLVCIMLMKPQPISLSVYAFVSWSVDQTSVKSNDNINNEAFHCGRCAAKALHEQDEKSNIKSAREVSLLDWCYVVKVFTGIHVQTLKDKKTQCALTG